MDPPGVHLEFDVGAFPSSLSFLFYFYVFDRQMVNYVCSRQVMNCI